MPRFFIGWLLGLGGAAIALIISALIFSGFDLEAGGFLGALVVFAILNAILPSIVLKVLVKYAESIIALSGLISTFLALLITDVLSDGLNISGVGTWIGSTLLVWILSVVIWLIPGPWRTYRKAKSAGS